VLRLIAVAAAMATGGVAFAQQPPALVSGGDLGQRPFRGASEPDPSAVTGTTQQLGFTLSAYRAYDDDTLSDGRDALDGRVFASGGYTGLTSALAYTRRSRRVTFGLAGAAAATQQETSGLLASYAVAAHAARRFRHWSVNGQAVAGYSPFYQFTIFLPESVGEAVGTDISRQADYSLFLRQTLVTDASVGLSRNVGSRMTLGITYADERVEFIETHERLVQQIAGVNSTYRLGKGLNLHLGYRYREARAIPLDERLPFRGHDVDAGVTYDRALSISKRTRIGFSMGSTLLANETGVQHYFFVVGDAQVTHEFGHTWGVSAGYHRGVQFVAAFREPFVTNVASAAIGGNIQRRLHLGAASYYSIGTVGLGSSGNRFDAVGGVVRLTVPVTRQLALFGEYLYYRNNFDAAIALPLGLTHAFERSGVRVGLRLSVPIINSHHGSPEVPTP
jgi:hypothetical protein